MSLFLYTLVSGTCKDLKTTGCSLGVFFEGEKESSGLGDFFRTSVRLSAHLRLEGWGRGTPPPCPFCQVYEARDEFWKFLPPLPALTFPCENCLTPDPEMGCRSWRWIRMRLENTVQSAFMPHECNISWPLLLSDCITLVLAVWPRHWCCAMTSWLDPIFQLCESTPLLPRNKFKVTRVIPLITRTHFHWVRHPVCRKSQEQWPPMV